MTSIQTGPKATRRNEGSSLASAHALYEVFYTNRALLWYREGNFHRMLQELHRFSIHERFATLSD